MTPQLVFKKLMFLLKEIDLYGVFCNYVLELRKNKIVHQYTQYNLFDKLQKINNICQTNPYQKLNFSYYGIDIIIKYNKIKNNNDILALILLLQILKMLNYKDNFIRYKLKNIKSFIKYE